MSASTADTLMEFLQEGLEDPKVPLESSSDDESLLQAEGGFDLDYRIPESETNSDDDEPVAKRPVRREVSNAENNNVLEPSSSTSSSTPPPQPSPSFTADLPSHPMSRSSVCLSQPPSPSSDMDLNEMEKRKRVPRKSPPHKYARIESAYSRMSEEERWNGADERDTKPEPHSFMPVRVPGPTFNITASWSPLTLFQLFFSPSVIRTIIDNTNANAQKKLQAGMKFVWAELTEKDFYTFLSITLFFGIVKLSHRPDYWRREWPYNFRFPSDSMTRARFEAIMWSLHLSDPEEDEDNDLKRGTAEHDRLFKIKPLYTDIVSACQTYFQPYQNISIDERIVVSNPKGFTRPFKRVKPTRLGYKLLVLADAVTSYTWNFSVHTGKKELIFGQDPLCSSVMDLLSLPVLGEGYTLFLNNVYASPALFEDLSQKSIGCCGTIRKNTDGFPKTRVNDLPKKAERGDLRWIRDGKLLFVKWMDNCEVTMCSTVHEAFSGKTVQRNVKEAGVWWTKALPVPDAVVDYNKSMSCPLTGTSHNVHHKTRKWYKSFFFHFLDIAVVNSFILHKELFKRKQDPATKKPLTQKTFREQLAKEMIQPTVIIDRMPPVPQSICMPVYFGEDSSEGRRYCKLCQDAGKRRVKTPVYCRKCLVPLCLTSRRNCFAEWHDALRYRFETCNRR